MDYLIKDSNLARAGKDRSVLGEPPWDAINRILQQSSFPYQLVAPEEINLLKPLRLELRGSDVEDAISLRDLSSGELSLVRFLLFAFAANRMARGPKLLLLDEPDAHLHCSLIQPFLIGIQNILIEEFGFRVIMTTHRTETLALAPEGSLYEMHRTGERIRKSESKTRTISMLTGSIVGIVYGGRRMVVVEDVADVAFYRSVFGTLRRSADWRPAIEPEFLSASWLVEVRRIRHAELRRVAADRQGPKGGKGNVRLVVNEFNSLGLTDVVAGLIDRDAALNADNRGSTMALPNVFTLERYSIENYLLDPLYVYVYLLHHGRKINVARELSIGEEPDLVKWNNEELQRIADLVGDGLKQNLTVRPSESELTQVDVLYTNGKHIKLPAWLLRRRGKDLRVAAAAFATPIIFKNEELEVAMQRIGFVPVELRDTLEAALGYRAST